ncbi:hypothetical protein SAMN05421752_11825 [Natronorubrum thiooxidans]|uniref:Uncharacterized protein n=1 Tax=Natronorubrum thiooxidans TaxID=308853 RepID=A0A1N7GYW0_9EURY|nr:hypothetical protein SAMN05421752_11825 [Natronorubrum thiooxidans]
MQNGVSGIRFWNFTSLMMSLDHPRHVQNGVCQSDVLNFLLSRQFSQPLSLEVFFSVADKIAKRHEQIGVFWLDMTHAKRCLPTENQGTSLFFHVAETGRFRHRGATEQQYTADRTTVL